MRSAPLFLTAFLALACSEQPTRPVQPPVRGLGDRLQSFMSFEPEAGKYGCPVCSRAGSPNLVAIGDASDPEFRADLAALESLLKQRPALKAFAVSTERFLDDAAGGTALLALRRSLGLSFPILVIPKDTARYAARGYIDFRELYPVAGRRTVLLSDAEGKVVFKAELTAANAEAQLAALSDQAAIVSQAL